MPKPVTPFCAKLILSGVTPLESNAVEIRLNPVSDGSEENKSFAAATPSGELKLTVTNPDLVSAFEVGQTFIVDFNAAEEGDFSDDEEEEEEEDDDDDEADEE